MTDAGLMGADCVHGVPWYECDECTRDDGSQDDWLDGAVHWADDVAP